MPLERRHAVGTDRADHLVHETFARGVENMHARVLIEQSAADRVQQMRLAHANAAVDEQWVVASRRAGGNRASRGVRELIARADDEALKAELWIKLRPS